MNHNRNLRAAGAVAALLVAGAAGAAFAHPHPEGEGDGKKTKVVICTRGDRPTAATAERIEKALARIRNNDELSDEQKARIETALRSAMERARSAR